MDDAAAALRSVAASVLPMTKPRSRYDESRIETAPDYSPAVMAKPIQPKAPTKRAARKQQTVVASTRLLEDLRALIGALREQVAQAVNSALVLLYWQVGTRIRSEILREKRAEYGEEILPTLSAKLTPEFGDGFSARNLARMIKFAEVFPDVKIVATLSRQLSWSHFVEIIPLKEQLQRDFYAEMCRIERWGVRKLREKIAGLLYERTAISRKPAELARQELRKLREEDQITPDLVFRDPYLLDFLGLSDTFSEKDIETAILRELQRFLRELGTDFAFIARQKRIVVGNDDHYIDLLFYHRRLRRLVVIDLKLGKFQAADKGQMELYLRWLAKYEQQPHEEAPIGLILCAEKSAEYVELLELEQTGIRVAEYLTELPPPQLLKRKLHDAIRRAGESLRSFE
jgi:predicted nuclease of restriction endonuclease-like (RecB) superfamily